MTMRATKARNINSDKKGLSPEQREELLRALKARFEKNMNRPKGLEWAQVQGKRQTNTPTRRLTASTDSVQTKWRE